MQTIGRRLATAFLTGALLVGGIVGLAPAASAGPLAADSRCNRNSHTHGALWWKRTDVFISRGYMPGAPPSKQYSYLHTNSQPVSCAS